MSSISFWQAIQIYAIEHSTTIPKLTEEMNRGGLPQQYNYVHQVLKNQRICPEIVAWFEQKCNLKQSDYK